MTEEGAAESRVTAKHPPNLARNRPRLAEAAGGRFLFVRDAIHFRSHGGLFKRAATVKKEGGAWQLQSCVTAKHPHHFARKLTSHRCDRLGRFQFVRDAIRFRSRSGLVQRAAATKKEGGAWQLRDSGNCQAPPSFCKKIDLASL